VLILFLGLNAKKVYIVPFWSLYHNNGLFNIKSHHFNRDGCNEPFFALKQALNKLGYQVQTAYIHQNMHDAEAIIVLDINKQWNQHLKKYKKQKKIALLFEPRTVRPINYDKGLHDIYDTIFIMDDRFSGERYRKLYYPQPTIKMIRPVPFNAKRLCTMISVNKNSSYKGELYSERKRAIEYFKNQNFIFYGLGWSKEKYKNYGGRVPNKLNTLSRFKFCICYENTSDQPGYITEKMLHSFVAGCVPIYLGAPNVEKHIPSDCFIDKRKFKDYRQLIGFLKSLKENAYEQYLNNIRKFLAFDKGFKFSIPFFVDSVLKEFVENFSLSKVFSSKELKKYCS